jgi:hypothetical protein
VIGPRYREDLCLNTAADGQQSTTATSLACSPRPRPWWSVEPAHLTGTANVLGQFVPTRLEG